MFSEMSESECALIHIHYGRDAAVPRRLHWANTADLKVSGPEASSSHAPNVIHLQIMQVLLERWRPM